MTQVLYLLLAVLAEKQKKIHRSIGFDELNFLALN